MRIRPIRTVESEDTCESCGETIYHREIGIAARPGEGLTWLVAARFCRAGCSPVPTG